jgi:hypothetical protein
MNKTKELNNIVENLNLLTSDLNEVQQDKLIILKWCMNAFKEDKKMSHIEFTLSNQSFDMKPHYTNKKDNELVTLRHKRYYKGLDLLESKCSHLKDITQEMKDELVKNNSSTNSWTLNKNLSNVNILINEQMIQELVLLLKNKNSLLSKIKSQRQTQIKEDNEKNLNQKQLNH